jgi:HAD superfamily hydrolase (TIGR01509 family)
VAYLQAARQAGLRRAVVSSSHNCEDVLRSADLTQYLEVRVDGQVIDALHLPGKPRPDSFLEAARRLHLRPDQCAVFEDALAGVAAGRAGAFGYVVGVNRVGQRDALLKHGADVVVDDLSELL